MSCSPSQLILREKRKRQKLCRDCGKRAGRFVLCLSCRRINANQARSWRANQIEVGE